MVHIVEQTDEEKIAMYMTIDKAELAKMLCECNKQLMRMIDPPKVEYLPYQTCPKCHGQGTVLKPNWVAGDQHEWSTSRASPYVCDVCNGARIIPMHMIKVETK